MTDLLFGENGVFHNDLDGRMNSAGSQHVYLKRGGMLPRRRPEPQTTPLHDGQVIDGKNWTVWVCEVLHQPGHIEPYALRLETEGGVLVYSGDTGPCDAIEELAHGAYILIYMCYFILGSFMKPGQQLMSSGHLEAAHTAAKACVKTLVAIHFTPRMDALGMKERCLAEMREIFEGRIIWGEDLMEIPLEANEIPHAG